MQPSPTAETSRLLLPSARISMAHPPSCSDRRSSRIGSILRRSAGVAQPSGTAARRASVRALLGLGLAILGVGTGAAAEMRPEVGNYRLAVDHVIAVADWEVDPASPHVLLFTDFRTGRIGVLREAGKDEWVLPTRLMSEDEAARLRFARRAGRIVALAVTEPGHP